MRKRRYKILLGLEPTKLDPPYHSGIIDNGKAIEYSFPRSEVQPGWIEFVCTGGQDPVRIEELVSKKLESGNFNPQFLELKTIANQADQLIQEWDIEKASKQPRNMGLDNHKPDIRLGPRPSDASD